MAILTFLERYAVRGVSLDVREPAEIVLRTKPAVRVTLRASDESIPASWGANLIVKARAEYEVSDPLAAQLIAKPPAEAPDPEDVWDESRRGLRAALWHWTQGENELEPITKQLTDILFQTFRVLRWRMGLGGDHYPFIRRASTGAVPAEAPS